MKNIFIIFLSVVFVFCFVNKSHARKIYFCQDRDRDGYGLFCYKGSDCNDRDRNINPGMTEIAYDGKDNDCKSSTLDDDLDGDGYALANDCDDTNPILNLSCQEEEEMGTGCDGLASFSSSGVEIGFNLSDAYEPSGAAWHFKLNDLILVSDEGTMSVVNEEGDILLNYSVSSPYRDLEAVAIADPDSAFVYLGVESPDSILEMNINTGQIIRVFDLTPWMQGADNSGLEALAFVPDSTSDEGGFFYAGHQGEGTLYVFELSLNSGGTSVSLVKTIASPQGFTDISGLDYDADTDTVYAIYDSFDQMIAMDIDGKVLESQSLPGNDQEGIAIGPGCAVYIAEDVGPEVWVY